MQDFVPTRRIPRAVKIAYALWILFWLPVYLTAYGPQNMLWMCDAGNIIFLIALFFESPLLISSQVVGLLLVQIVWTLDFFSAWLFETHLIGGTEYMFDTARPLWLRSLSLFHVVLPPLLIWSVWRVGYDRRGWVLQTVIVWALLLVTFFFSDPSLNINWLTDPLGDRPDWLPQPLVLPLMMLLYPLIVFIPSHYLLRRLVKPPSK